MRGGFLGKRLGCWRDLAEGSFDVGPHGGGAFVAVIALERECSIDDPRVWLAYVTGDGSDARRGQLRHLRNELYRSVRLVDPHPRANAKAGGRQGEQIGAPVDLIETPGRLLGRHEGRRSERKAIRSDRLTLLQSRKPEVEYFDARLGLLGLAAFAGEKQVLGLDVSVHDASRVCDLQYLEHAFGNLQEFSLADGRSPLEAVLHRLALEKFHHQIGGAGDGTRGDDVVVKHPNDAGMADLVGCIALSLKALAYLRVRRQLRVQ